MSYRDNANTPKIHRLAMACLEKYFGSDIAGCAACCHKYIIMVLENLGQAEVGDHQLSILFRRIEKQLWHGVSCLFFWCVKVLYVLGFDIAMNNLDKKE